MRQALKGALLSGLVFPGLGQLALKRMLRGLAFVAVASVCTWHIVNTAVVVVMQSLPTLEPGTNLIHTPPPVGTHESWIASLLLVCWIASVVDAFWLGNQLDQAEKTAGPGPD